MALLRAIFLWKNKEMFHVKRQYSFSAVRKMVLICLRKHAPIASQGQRQAAAKEEKKI